jgi:long-chain acyl-CoA synthetase
VPTLFKAMLDKGATREQLASINCCISGGAPLPLEVKRAFEAASGCTLVEGYGLTEASPGLLLQPAAGGEPRRHHRPAPAGRGGEIRSWTIPYHALPVGERGSSACAGPT